MFAAKTTSLVLACVTLAAASGTLRGAVFHNTSSPSPADKPKELETLAVDFEIENVNYYDMTQTLEDSNFTDGDSQGQPQGDPNAWMESLDDDAPGKKKGKKGSSGPLGTDGVDEGVANAADSIDQGLDNVLDGAGDGAVQTGGTTAPTEAASGIDKGLANVFGGDGDAEKEEGGDGALTPWPTKTTNALIQMQSKQVSSQLSGITVQKALRRSIEGAVKGLICASAAGPGPGPAPAPAPAPALLPSGPPAGMLPPPVQVSLASMRGHAANLPSAVPAPAAAPGPAPGPMMAACPKVHVALLPGDVMKKKHVNNMINKPPPNAPFPRGVMVRMMIFDRPNNGVNDMLAAKGMLNQALATGLLQNTLKHAVEAVTGVEPKMSGVKIKSTVVKAWDTPKCEKRMSELVKELGVAYSRRQVPIAMYNECTNFMTKMSFSHDYVLDGRDAVRCREATRSFALRWKLGKKLEPKDNEAMCVRFCEAKFGNDAPTCNMHGGDNLAEQPL